MSREAFEKAMALGYRDRFGFPIGKQGEIINPSGNCLMFLAEEMIIRRDFGTGDAGEDLAHFLELAGLCQLETGNFRRTPPGCPFSNDQEGWDDFIGLTAAMAVTRVGSAFSIDAVKLIVQILVFGRRHFFRWGPFRLPYCYPTTDPAPEESRTWAPFFGRYLQFVAHLRWCAGEKPNLVQRLVWCWSVAFAGLGDPDGQDPWRLTYLFVRAQRTERTWGQPEALAERIWRWRFKRRWPGGIRDVRARYFNDGKHPLAVFASMDF